jgi:tRNA modification GTPase
MAEEIICAPATSPFNSALSIIRVSGTGVFDITPVFFKAFTNYEDRKALYGTIVNREGHSLDDVVLTPFKGPRSFTGEDTIEISCHGNPLIVQSILQLLIDEHGVRMAQPGEFTRRAFINGKVDLTEAEAINSIIQAKSEWEVNASLQQMHGSLKNAVASLKDELILLKANIEAAIDFSQEEIEFVSYDQAISQTEGVKSHIEDIYLRCKVSEKMRHGVDIAIVGKPNVGKSSILNMIINSERAIVSDIPGTTRDIIKESVQLGGVHVNFIDTAGIHATEDLVEKIGIKKSHEEIAQAVYVLAVFDNTTGLEASDRELLEILPKDNTFPLVNKCDSESSHSFEDLKDLFAEQSISFSAKQGLGFDILEKRLSEKIQSGFGNVKNNFVADLRIVTLLKTALSMSDGLIHSLMNSEPEEIIAFQINDIINTLEEITGDISDEDVLESIFTRFCIGK